MPEGRFISKGISVSEQLGEVSLEADFLFGRCIPHLDVDGRIVGNPKTLKATVCPLRDELSSQKIYRLLAELHAAGLVVWYEVKGLRFLEFPTFARHQKGMHRDREASSKIPSSQDEAAQPVTDKSGSGQDEVGMKSADSAELVRLSKVKLSEVKVSEVKSTDSSESGPRESNRARHKPVPKYPHFPTADSGRFHQTCLANGYVVDAGLLRKTLAPLYPEAGPIHPADALDNALLAFLEARGSVSPDKARFWTIIQFASDIGRWVRMGAMPRQDPETGAPTERGLLLVGAA